VRGRTKITKRLVESTVASDADIFLWDSEVRGFGLRVRKSGHRSYVLQYRHVGRARRYLIGAHGSPWTPETARAEATRLLGSVASDVDVQAEKTERRNEMTIAELCDLYVEEGLATRKASSVVAARADIENHIKPILGAYRVANLARADVDRLLLDVGAGFTKRTARTRKKRGLSRVRGGKGAANSTVQTLSAALGFAVSRSLRPDNPAIGVRRFPGRKIERFLSPAELARLGEALAAAEALGVESPYAIAAIRLLALTGCRRNEVLTLKRSHIDLTHKCLRLPDSKTGAKTVHLGSAAIALLQTIPQVSGNPYLLPGSGAAGHLVDLQPAWVRIRKAADLDDVRLHDLRHSFASVGAVSGDSLLIIGALLGHRSAKTTERYTHLADHPLKGAADRISGEIAQHLGIALERVDQAPIVDIDSLAEHDASALGSILGTVIKTRWLNTDAVAQRLALKVSTLETYRWLGTGPTFRKIGRRVVYAAEAVEEWRRSRVAAVGT